jgi:ABC-type antimicrobial peptide transport system permease subunit
MMLAERKHEMAIMITLGMQRFRMIRLLSAELIIICFLGLLGGFLGSIPILTYFHFHPIQMTGDIVKAYEAFGMEPVIPVAWQIGYMVQQVINIACIIALVLIYPLYSIFKLDLTRGLRRN